MKEEEFYDRMYRLCYITRYDTVPRVKDENVAEHSFLVSALLLKLNDIYNFDLGNALIISTSHDVLENETGDVGHIVKYNHPELYEVLKVVEKKALKKYPPAIITGINAYDDNDTIESKIVHLADAIQCQQYAENEIRLGSHYYFNEVKENSERRIKELKVMLKNYVKE